MVRAATPTPTPSPEFDETLVTPGPWGFAVMFVLAALIVFLIVDMVRRVRRVQYRAEFHERLAREQAATATVSSASGGETEPPGRGDTAPRA